MTKLLKIGDVIPYTPSPLPPALPAPTGWFPVQTNSREETVAVESLRAIGMTMFYPRHMVNIRHARKSVSELRPHLPRYVFAEASPATLGRILRAKGVAGLVEGAGGPFVIPPSGWALFRKQYEVDGIWIEPPPKAAPQYEVGQTVRMTDGPFVGFLAIVERVDAGDRISVSMSVFGGATPAVVPVGWVEAVASPQSAEPAETAPA